MPDEYNQIPINPSEICRRAFELMQEKQYEDAEKLLSSNMSKVDDNVAVGLFHSALGVLFKLRGEVKTAWKHYERAEKLIPGDPALKIITARLLIDNFGEYDLAIRKVKKALTTIENNPVFAHQVYTTMGLAYLGKRSKKQAVDMLKKSMDKDFSGFVSAQNIDFSLVEMLLRAGVGIEESKTFLEKARKFAEAQKEETWVELIDRMLSAFPKEKE